MGTIWTNFKLVKLTNLSFQCTSPDILMFFRFRYVCKKQKMLNWLNNEN